MREFSLSFSYYNIAEVHLGDAMWYCLVLSHVFTSSSLLGDQMAYVKESINLMSGQIWKCVGYLTSQASEFAMNLFKSHPRSLTTFGCVTSVLKSNFSSNQSIRELDLTVSSLGRLLWGGQINLLYLWKGWGKDNSGWSLSNGVDFSGQERKGEEYERMLAWTRLVMVEIK